MVDAVRDLEHCFNIGGRVHVAQVRSPNPHSAAPLRRGIARYLLPPLVFVLASCNQMSSVLGPRQQQIVLLDQPAVLEDKAIRLKSTTVIKVLGRTSELCASLSNTIRIDADFNSEYLRLIGPTHIHAVLHTREGMSYEWKSAHWAFTPSVGTASTGTLFACLRWEENKSPPKGTQIDAVDLSSDQPLHTLEVSWWSTDAFD
jgi:hypothetical protein